MKVTLNYHYKDLKKEVEMKKKNVHVKRQISAFKEDAWFFYFFFQSHRECLSPPAARLLLLFMCFYI